jgi:hypothetical protein
MEGCTDAVSDSQPRRRGGRRSHRVAVIVKQTKIWSNRFSRRKCPPELFVGWFVEGKVRVFSENLILP